MQTFDVNIEGEHKWTLILLRIDCKLSFDFVSKYVVFLFCLQVLLPPIVRRLWPTIGDSIRRHISWSQRHKNGPEVSEYKATDHVQTFDVNIEGEHKWTMIVLTIDRSEALLAKF